MANPLDRSWYNGLVDDDGSGTVGSVWDKADVDSLMDAIDASLAGVVDRSGAPGANQIGMFADADTLKADPNLAWDPAFTQLIITAPPVSGACRVSLVDTAQVANSRVMRIDHEAQQVRVRAIDDAGATTAEPLAARRDGDVLIGRWLYVNGGSVIFPTTPAPSGSATALDDYRELTWTPIWTGSTGATGVTYSMQHGRGVKVGRQVTLWCALTVALPGTIGGTVRLWGLPLAATAEISAPGSLLVSAFTPTAQGYGSVSGYMSPGGDWVDLTYVSWSGTGVLEAVPGSMIVAGTTIYCEIRYLAAS